MKKRIAFISLMIFNIIISSLISSAYSKSYDDSLMKKSQIEIKDSNDPPTLETYIDDFIHKKMEEYHIPGLAFVMVKDGEIFLSKGYGYADVTEKTAVKPGETLLRVGSVSKLFTATAVMQLVEQGKLNLKTDVNEYLTLFKLPENYPEPVTPHNLLTHTSGFRSKPIGILTRDEGERKPIGDFLASNMLPRSLPPGSVIIYSNHGFYLAGHLVETISGCSFEQYMEEGILQPLEMQNSSFAMTDKLSSSLANGYQFINGNYEVVPAEYSIIKPSPAGSLIATAEDIAHFMIAQLQRGKYKNQQILNENTCTEMQKQQFTNDPKLPGVCYGFYEYKDYNQRAIMHDGDVSGFSSRLFLLPECNLGFFVCINTGNSILRMEITDHLMSYFFKRPEDTSTKEIPEDKPFKETKLTGFYRGVRLGLDSFDKLTYTGEVWELTENTANSLIELEPGLFQFPQSNTKITYREDEKGNVKYIHMDAQQMPISYERLAWYEEYLRFAELWYGIFALIFFCIGVLRPLVNKIRARKNPGPAHSRLIRYTKFSATIVSIIYLTFIAGFAPAFMMNEEQFAFGVPFIIKALLVLPLINMILSLAFIIFFIKSWKDEHWNFKRRLGYIFTAFIFIGFAFYLNYWNLIGFQY